MRNISKINNLLSELKKTYFSEGIKTELSSECLDDNGLMLLKKTADNASLSFTVKIAGAEDEAGILRSIVSEAENIVVPMVESAYSLEKFIKLVRKQSKDINIWANIETITGYNNFDEILNTAYKEIKGIVFGRSDFCNSVGLTCRDVDSELVFKYVKDISLKTLKLKKKFCVGGRISAESVDFLKEIPYLSGFETRKVIFNSNVLNYSCSDAIKKALEFELLWLDSENPSVFDLERIEVIKRRF